MGRPATRFRLSTCRPSWRSKPELASGGACPRGRPPPPTVPASGRLAHEGAIGVEEIGELAPSAIVLSPGPCTPKEAGVSVEAIRRWGSTIPILGVCLGHQAIGEAYGGEVVRAERVMHGKTSQIEHDGTGIFAGLPSPMQVMRYHSLIVERRTMPGALEIVAVASDDPTEVHAVKHREHPVYGVQFHPESVMTPQGKSLLENFLELAR